MQEFLLINNCQLTLYDCLGQSPAKLSVTTLVVMNGENLA